MDTTVITRNERYTMAMMQVNLSNRLHTIASRTRINIAGKIDYWETYIGYLMEYRSHMTNQDTIERCNKTISDMRTKISVLRGKYDDEYVQRGM